LGGLDGEILVEKAHNAVCEACLVLMSRGIVGSFETWKPGIRYLCMMGDIASTAELMVHESDDGIVHFARWRPFDQNGVSRSAGPAPAREDDGVGRRVATDTIARSGTGGESMAETAGEAKARLPPPGFDRGKHRYRDDPCFSNANVVDVNGTGVQNAE
jgi:hypothetical protein